MTCSSDSKQRSSDKCLDSRHELQAGNDSHTASDSSSIHFIMRDSSQQMEPVSDWGGHIGTLTVLDTQKVS